MLTPPALGFEIRERPAPRARPAPRRHVRPPSDAHSTIYNTDENYDINRHGYHDSHDTMENIDLDYGAALVSIAIETVARAARR